jgi:murein DD-endopeptidase MepM/ murein hydrolase activator NlpD
LDKHFTITIHDESGVKQYSLHKIVKKTFIYLFLFFVSFGIISAVAIFYLNKNLTSIEVKKEKLEHAYKEIQEEHQQLQKEMNQTKKSLLSKREQLEELSNSLSEIEMLMGLRSTDDETLLQRVSVAKLSSAQKSILLQLIPSGYPIEYKGITSSFGYRIHPTKKKKEFHRGVDLKAKMKTPVYATADAIVEWAGMHKRSGFGRLIILQHVYGFKTYYGHLNKVVIKSGAFVKKGQLIGYTGNSGLSNGPHLHYELHFISRVLNPYHFMKWNMINYDAIFTKEKKVPWQSLIAATSRLRVVAQKQIQPSSLSEQKSKVK